MATSNLTAERLRELLDYNPETGVFTWRVRRGMALAGSVAGNRRADDGGRVTIYVDNRAYKAARLAWLYVRGEWPAPGMDIDHINGNPSEDRFSNLREVTRAGNAQNQRRARSDSGTGILGVNKHGDRWRAAIRTNGKSNFLGYFDTAEEAQAAYLAAKRVEHVTCSI